MRKVCKVKLVKIITYFFWRWIRHNYFTSLSISLNRKLRIIPIQIPILYEHLLSFTKSLRALWIYASLRNAELVRKEEALYLRFFTHELKIRKLWISCCVNQTIHWQRILREEDCRSGTPGSNLLSHRNFFPLKLKRLALWQHLLSRN